MKFTKKQLIDKIQTKLESHPGDAPWSCIECYHNRPCIEKEILEAALKWLKNE